MFLEESYWIKKELQKTSDIKNAIDIGASTLEFRTIKQPYIEENVFKPLRDRGIEITHVDMKDQEGVDISYDIGDKSFSIKQKFDLVICTNILEHIDNLDISITNISNLVNDKGYLLVTVPFIYPYHPDPIDTMSRFGVNDLETLFKNFDNISAKIIDIESKAIFNRIIFCTFSIINIFRKMKFIYFYDNIKNIFVKRPKVTCVFFRKRQYKGIMEG